MPSRLTGPDLVRLKKSVVANFDSSNWRELGALTNTLDEIERHDRFLRSLSWGDSDYDGLALTFLRKMIGPNDENLSVVLDYVNTKCATTGDDISSEQTEGRKVIFSPNLFQVPSEPASCITFLSEQAFAPQNTRFWSRRRVWFQFTGGEDKPPMPTVDNRGKGVLSMDCSAKRSPL